LISRRGLTLGSLASLPVLIYVILGSYALWTTGLLQRLWWLLPVCWALTWALSKIWRPERPSAERQHTLPITSHFTSRDREAAEIVRQFQQQVDDLTPEQLTDIYFYGRQVQALATALARHYHPGATDPYTSLTVPEVVAAFRLAVDDMEEWLLSSAPGSRLLTIKQWQMLQHAPKWYRRVQNAAWVAGMLMNPINIARYWSSKMTAEPVTTELQTELLAVIYLRFIRQMGFYLIEMNSGRLRSGADAYRHAFPFESAGAQGRVSEERLARQVRARPVGVALVGQVSSGKSSLVNAVTGVHQAAVDLLPETQDVARYQMAVGDPPVAVTLLDTPGYGEAGATTDQVRQIRSALRECDAVLVVMDAHSPAREADLRTVRDLEAWYASQPCLKPPPMVGVLTHIDLLRPTLEWSPPYEWREPKRPKEHSIHDAVGYVRDLFGASLAQVVPLCSDVERKRDWGILEGLIPALTEILDDAQSAALLRAFEHELDRDRLKIVLNQIKRSGGQLVRAWIEERLMAAKGGTPEASRSEN
jgi:uncharacterized protein